MALSLQRMLNAYVYWTVHHLDRWIKRDQLDVTCFIISLFNVQHVSDVNTSILRSLRLICWVISWVVLFWIDVCWCYVVVWLWWCGIRMQAEALVPNMFRMLIHPSAGACDLFFLISWVVLFWFDVCWYYVVVWLGWCGIRMQAEALVPDTTPPQPNHNITPTHIEPEKYNPWNNSTNKSLAPEDGCINIRKMLSVK